MPRKPKERPAEKRPDSRLKRCVVEYLERHGRSRQIDLITDLSMHHDVLKRICDLLISEQKIIRDSHWRYSLVRNEKQINGWAAMRWTRGRRKPAPVLLVRVA